MNLIKKSQWVLIWIAAVSCLFVGFYAAFEHTMHFFANNNYFFSPFADDILDNANFTYPIATGNEGLKHIFDPFSDHRVATERVQELIDFIFTNGVQVLQPYRLSILLWANFFLVTFFIIKPNPNLTQPTKILLSGTYLLFLFAGISINSFISTMQFTWPVIYLFVLLTFIFTAKYCAIIDQSGPTKLAYTYILLTFLCVNITLYTFNIGSILWPIVFLILYKQKCLHRHAFIWIGLAALTYYYYIAPEWVLDNYYSYTSHSNLTSVLQRPLQTFYNMSRTLAILFNTDAFYQFTLSSFVIGSLTILSSTLIIINFLKMKRWSSPEIIFIGYFIFILLSLFIIATMRVAAEWRFFMTALLFLFCNIMAFFLLPISSNLIKNILHTTFTILLAIWLVAFFIPRDYELSGGTYEVGFFNQVFISEATGIPLDDNFMQASKIYQTSGNLPPHLKVNGVQQKFKKGPYSFWAAQQIGQSLENLNLQKMELKTQANIRVIYDYRPKRSPGVLINVKLENYPQLLNKNWEVIFTNEQNKIIGFAISAPYLQSLWSVIKGEQLNFIIWRGAVNTVSVDTNQRIDAWAINQSDKRLYHLGNLIMPSPNFAQKEPTWVWQKTLKFGLDEDMPGTS